MIPVFLLGTEESKVQHAKGSDLQMGEEINLSDLAVSKIYF